MAVNKIELSLKEVLKQAIIKNEYVEDYNLEQIVIEIPKDKAHGDYSSNIAMQLTKLLRRNPREIAQGIIDSIDFNAGNIEKVEIAGPGFINFFLKKLVKEVLIPVSEVPPSTFSSPFVKTCHVSDRLSVHSITISASIPSS